MNKDQQQQGPSFSVLPSFQELEWGTMREAGWPAAAAASTAGNAHALPRQSAQEQARTAEAAKLAASVLSAAPAALPMMQQQSKAVVDPARERIRQWFDQWSHAGRMALYGAVPEPFRAFYPLASEDQPVELDPDLEACILHYVAWEARQKK